MNNEIFPYEVQIYNRNFLNCAQRQSIVMLKRAGVEVDALFYTAQVSTDRILEFSLVEGAPKYDFHYHGLTDADFRVVGVKRENHYVDDFFNVRPMLLDTIARDGFVLSACNLFHIAHRPEYYRKKDVLHFQVLTGYRPDEEAWDVIDDNSAGILTRFSFSDDFLASLYDTGVLKGYRSFALTPRGPEAVWEEIEALFVSDRTRRVDSLRLLTELEAHISLEPERLKMLGEAFSLLSGSRQCFAQYLKWAGAADVSIDGAEEVGREAARLRDAFTMGQVSGKLNVASMLRRALAIAEVERRLGDACHMLPMPRRRPAERSGLRDELRI